MKDEARPNALGKERPHEPQPVKSEEPVGAEVGTAKGNFVGVEWDSVDCVRVV